nr:hypothetical protein [Tanacetum cinerariifolium]
ARAPVARQQPHEGGTIAGIVAEQARDRASRVAGSGGHESIHVERAFEMRHVGTGLGGHGVVARLQVAPVLGE